MASGLGSHEDQLVAAVSDGMDPITFLVWCEQNLSPKELPTLNRLLRIDDGILAQEVGWNLLELIVPMLRENPQEAANCLECIARRGNPREVIVKVAEVLEKLGEDTDSFEDDEESVDELPTFAGEADRIHLGTLTLDGQPVLADVKSVETAQADQKTADARPDHHNESLPSLQFQALVLMLGVLHLRIKTQYPSRFLATSLPAALGAYRRIGVTAPSTLAFLSFLGKLSGRKPQLPVRNLPVTAGANLSQVPEAFPPSTISLTPSMPDSEPEIEGSSMQQASQNEKDIVLKLLQAVLLEALDDYMAALQSRDPPYMSWTTRLREKVEPSRLVPRKLTEFQKWRDSKHLSERDRVLEEFLKISKELKFNVDNHFRILLDEDGKLTCPPSEDEAAQSPSEYPTNPSQVPFPPSGMLFLYAAQRFYTYQSGTLESEAENTQGMISQVYQFFRSEQNAAYLHASFATQDALLLLLYLARDSPSLSATSFHFKSLFMSLAAFCAEFPDPQLRDAAHNIATKLFHACLNVKTKLSLVTEILQHETTPVNLKAVAVNWVKDEIAKPSSQDPHPPRQARIQDTDLDSDATILPLLFPDRDSPNTSRGEVGTYDAFELPYYIASLNLACVVASGPTSTRSESAMKSAVAGLSEWRSSHHDLEEVGVPNEAPGQIKASLDECRMDMWALDDALTRCRVAMKHTKTA
jgi:hypothetical protein